MNKCPEFLPDQADKNLSEILNPKRQVILENTKHPIIIQLEEEGFF